MKSSDYLCSHYCLLFVVVMCKLCADAVLTFNAGPWRYEWGSGILSVIEVPPTEQQDQPENVPQQAALICWSVQVKGLNDWRSSAILSDLNTFNLALMTNHLPV